MNHIMKHTLSRIHPLKGTEIAMKTNLTLIASVFVLTVAFSSHAHSADSGHVTCVNKACHATFASRNNKAPWWDAIVVGAAGGGAVGGATGAWIGTGTGVVVGGWGAVPGWYVGTTAGWLFGGVVGGIGGAWYRDRQVKCPECGEIFTNPQL